MDKVILLVADGLSYLTAVEQCGYLESLVAGGKARRWKMQGVLPTLSAPVYETLHTWLEPHEHGITANDNLRASNRSHVFGLARDAGKTTGAVANFYFSVLYNGDPWVPMRDMEVDDDARVIQHARFHTDTGYTKFNLSIPSDADLTTQVSIMIDRHAPDYILYHNCSCDSVGHAYGSQSPEYKKTAWKVDNQLAQHVDFWRENGYRILVTADHGFTDFGHHGGTTDDVRDVPFYDIGHPNPGIAEEVADQLAVAPTILSRMGVEIPPVMKAAPLA